MCAIRKHIVRTRNIIQRITRVFNQTYHHRFRCNVRCAVFMSFLNPIGYVFHTELRTSYNNNNIPMRFYSFSTCVYNICYVITTRMAPFEFTLHIQFDRYRYKAFLIFIKTTPTDYLKGTWLRAAKMETYEYGMVSKTAIPLKSALVMKRLLCIKK